MITLATLRLGHPSAGIVRRVSGVFDLGQDDPHLGQVGAPGLGRRQPPRPVRHFPNHGVLDGAVKGDDHPAAGAEGPDVTGSTEGNPARRSCVRPKLSPLAGPALRSPYSENLDARAHVQSGWTGPGGGVTWRCEFAVILLEGLC